MVTMYEYDDQGRVARTVTRPEWTAEDRVLMAARAAHRRTLCTGCGHPKATAWHPDNEGWFETSHVTCHACTAERGVEVNGTIQPIEWTSSRYARPDDKPLPPFPEVLWEPT